MTLSTGLVGAAIDRAAGLPCASCLFDLGEASGMAGAGACPLKAVLLRRHAEPRQVGAPVRDASCDAFMPGYAEAGLEQAFVGGGTDVRPYLS
ncbi:hypothetical protein [Bosea sp. 124]|uniref:hypothetical protein n=1 Tax=Bosea sp. 124 TaxID=2135642 RepID=UPI000D38FE07|nr:hypothetical protein [Bosea sp. 124]PTM41674.1 hypothetical protein C8D03_3244 [Bosea sp. 124]